MANVIIKKNFVDGDKLFAQQLNNNFETIEKAINDGNKIVWQDGTEVKFKRYVTNDIDSLPVLDGSVIYDIEKGRHYIDYKGERVQVGSAGKEVIIQETEPTEEDNKIWIDSDVVNTMGTEIINEHSDSNILGYSANYLNERLTKVSPTEPTTGEEVWIQKGKNLFNPLHTVQGYTNNNGGDVKGNGASTDLIKVVGGKDYYILSNKTNGNWGAWYDENKNFISGIGFGENTNKIELAPNNAKYFRFTLSYNDNNPNYANNVMIAQSSVPIDYEPYIEKKIYVKNDNGVYEEFYKNNGIVESGSNENGSWVKWSDGTMICTLYKSGSGIDSIQYGESILYTATYDWIFPQKFANIPSVSCSLFRLGTGASWGGVLAISNKNAILYSYDTYQRTNASYVLSAIVIGKWK